MAKITYHRTIHRINDVLASLFSNIYVSKKLYRYDDDGEVSGVKPYRVRAFWGSRSNIVSLLVKGTGADGQDGDALYQKIARYLPKIGFIIDGITIDQSRMRPPYNKIKDIQYDKDTGLIRTENQISEVRNESIPVDINYRVSVVASEFDELANVIEQVSPAFTNLVKIPFNLNSETVNEGDMESTGTNISLNFLLSDITIEQIIEGGLADTKAKNAAAFTITCKTEIQGPVLDNNYAERIIIDLDGEKLIKVPTPADLIE